MSDRLKKAGIHSSMLQTRPMKTHVLTADIVWYGKNGMISGWPGVDVYPEQPMIRQIRRFLNDYSLAGGCFEEHCITGAGHSPHIEDPARIAALLKDENDF